MFGAITWQLARASGVVCWMFATIAVLWGVIMSGRGLGVKYSPRWFDEVHRWVGALTVWFLALHLGALVTDSYVDFDLSDLLIPFASNWKSSAVAWGVISMWVLLAVEISSLLRSRIPRKAWKTIHLSSYVAFFAATIHGLTAGTDATKPWMFWLTCGGVVAVGVATVVRILAERRRRVIRPVLIGQGSFDHLR